MMEVDEKIVCPYNPAHFILSSRMQVHITKCKKNYPNLRLATCDFNVNHKIPIPELQFHHKNCPDRRVAEVIVCGTQDYNPNKFPVVDNIGPLEDDWSNELGTSSYDPTAYLESNEILRRKDVAPAAVRKNFKHEERQRINQLTSHKTSRPPRELQGPSQAHTSRPLPKTQTAVKITEETPKEVSDLMQKIKESRNRPFIPK